MLKEAIEIQQRAVNTLMEKIRTKDELTFKAPTGSGKTYMMADFINRCLSASDDVVFLVSTLSKGNLAQQNYEKFLSYVDNANFKNLKPHLINTNISGEERLFIPIDYNVYLLPRDLYKSGGRLMQGAMENFLNTLTSSGLFGGLNKKIYLVKDECHIATNNLDNLSATFFSKVINFSATPNIKRGQQPDVEINEEEAIQAKLIKTIELGDENDDISVAIKKFEEIKDAYRNLLDVNPCLIIQISNKEKADYELNNVIFPELKKAEHQDLKWMLIVDKERDCDTNDFFKAKKMPVSRWKEYTKQNTSMIDIIIFKMVISEGWDIPRACMLYQIRDSKSTQLNEQIMGRVRRNPKLLEFENLSPEAQKLAMTAWVWGILPEGGKRTFCVKLAEEPEDITSELKINTTKLKTLTKKKDFDVDKLISSSTTSSYANIFDLHRKLIKAEDNIRNMCYSYADSVSKWWKFAENLDKISLEADNFSCDYANSMELSSDENGQVLTKSLPLVSTYTDNGNYVNIGDWVWKRSDGKDKFSFDSEAERQWCSILKDLSALDIGNNSRVTKKVMTGKKNPLAGNVDIFGNVEPDRLKPMNRFLWGKNYVAGSEIKYEYYLNGLHSSYPDFILKDSFDRIHIFEVKSVNISSDMPSAFDSEQYKKKIEELKKCYKQASLLTGYIFYLPVLKDDVWQIIQLIGGEDRKLTQEEFIDFMRHDLPPYLGQL